MIYREIRLEKAFKFDTIPAFFLRADPEKSDGFKGAPPIAQDSQACSTAPIGFRCQAGNETGHSNSLHQLVKLTTSRMFSLSFASTGFRLLLSFDFPGKFAYLKNIKIRKVLLPSRKSSTLWSTAKIGKYTHKVGQEDTFSTTKVSKKLALYETVMNCMLLYLCQEI